MTDFRLVCLWCRPRQVEEVLVRELSIQDKAISFAWTPIQPGPQLCPRCRTLRPVAGRLSWTVGETREEN